MSLGATVIDAVYAAMPEVRASLRVGEDVIAKAICAGLEETRQWSDNGQFMAADLRVRIKAEDATATGMEFGDQIEVKRYGEEDYTRFRIVGKKHVAGLLHFALENLHE